MVLVASDHVRRRHDEALRGGLRGVARGRTEAHALVLVHEEARAVPERLAVGHRRCTTAPTRARTLRARSSTPARAAPSARSKTSARSVHLRSRAPSRAAPRRRPRARRSAAPSNRGGHMQEVDVRRGARVGGRAQLQRATLVGRQDGLTNM